MKSKFSNIEAEVLSESVISSFRSQQAPQARLILQPRQQRPFTPATINSHHVQQEVKRKSISVFLFGMSSFAFLVLAFQDIPLILEANCDTKTYFSMGSLIGITLVMLGASIYFVEWKEMFFLYFLLDTVLISWIVSMIGLIGMLNVFQPRAPFFAQILKILGPISSFCTAGAYRILIKHANFNRWQNIIFKVSIMADGMCYFMLGVYEMYTNHQISAGMVPSMDSLYKDFHLLFVFGGLVFFKQLVNLHNRFDRTGKLSHNYKLTDQIEEQIEINMQEDSLNSDIQSENQPNKQQKNERQLPSLYVNSNQLSGQFQNKLSQKMQNIIEQLKNGKVQVKDQI